MKSPNPYHKFNQERLEVYRFLDKQGEKPGFVDDLEAMMIAVDAYLPPEQCNYALCGSADGDFCLEFDWWDDWCVLLLQDSPGKWYLDDEDHLGFPTRSIEDTLPVLKGFLDEADREHKKAQ